MSDYTFQLRDVSKAYNGRRVLHIPELDIRCGEVFAIVGPSGAGKSTLLRLLNFLEPPDAGVIRFGGQEYGLGRAMPLELRRRVTTVFQSPMLLNRSVWDNVRYGLWVRGNGDSACLVADTLGQVGLSAFARQRARTLSGGEAQRVALARAMVLDLDALLLDEPTANLDPHNVALIEDIVRTLNREKGTTLVLVTHNIFQARRLAGRVGLMLDGRLIEVAEVDAFFERPVDPRTAAFVRGEMVY
jgi:tungstate transport system ATP-binding protein